MTTRYYVWLVVLVWPAIAGGQILNPGFEQYRSVTPYPDTVPQYWRLKNTDYTLFGSMVTSAWTPPWKTEGLRSEGLYSRFGRSFAAGDYQGIWQTVDLTEVGSIVFDVRLAAYGSTELTEFAGFEASFLVGGVALWTATADGTYLNQQVNVSGFSGVREIELRITARTAGQYDVANWVQWDNLRTMAQPAETVVEAFVDLDPDTLNCGSSGKWITCHIALPAEYDVRHIDGATVTLEEVGAHMGPEGWATAEANAGNLVDRNEDGIYERMVKFDRAAVQAVLTAGNATVTVRGRLDESTTFQGTAVLRVIDRGNKG